MMLLPSWLLPKRNSSSIIKTIIALLLIFFAVDQVLKIQKLENLEYSNKLEKAKDNFNDQRLQQEVPDIQEVGGDGTLPQKIDWHDWDKILSDASREGPGEQGKPVQITVSEINGKEYETLFSQNGFSGYTSDKISLDRSVPDIRHKDCRKQTYLRDLPPASIILPFFNEHLSTLLRSVHSIINRSPSDLVKEIILVDDGSSKAHCKATLDRYIAENSDFLENKVRVVRLPQREGLISARLAGAKNAKSEVLIFLDSHIEVNVNWLPPLLEPLALDNKTAVCPFIDVLNYDTFAYTAQDEGARGAWAWNMDYKRLPRLHEDVYHPIRPFDSPVMAGGLFAIRTAYFWELGGYDEGLRIWGAEQYELSFKIWQCGGRMVDVPCSRVGHVYRKYAPFTFMNTIGRNHKRVIEVWMDDYKEFVYKRRPDWRSEDAGDLSKQLDIRKKLKCKPFKWFMENVAFDQEKHYPATIPPDFASGFIQSQASNDLCVYYQMYERLSLATCNPNDLYGQKFKFTYHRDIQLGMGEDDLGMCIDVSTPLPKAALGTFGCHGQGGNQLFKYDATKMRVMQPNKGTCLDFDPNSRELFMDHCEDGAKTQEWLVENINHEMLDKWDSVAEM